MKTQKESSIDDNSPGGTRWHRPAGWAGLLLMVVLLSGCADSIGFAEAAVREPVGFWYGLWHGIICPFSFIISLFDSDVAIYAIYNNGAWYDFGFVLGVGTLMGGSSQST